MIRCRRWFPWRARSRVWGWLRESGCDAGRCRLFVLIGIVLRSGGVCVCVNVRFVWGALLRSWVAVLRVVVCLSSLCVESGSRVCPVRG